MPRTERNAEWLAKYYDRIVLDCRLSFERRNRTTHWSFVVLGVMVAIYAGSFVEGSQIAQLGRFGLIAVALFVMVRLFFMSAIAYGFYLKGRHLRTVIEKHWMHGDPSLDQVISDVTQYDHGKSMPDTGRNRFLGELYSGTFLTTVIPLIPLYIELSSYNDWRHWLIIVILVAYIIWEVYSFKRYDQMQKRTDPASEQAGQ